MRIHRIPKPVFRQMIRFHAFVYRITKGALGYHPHRMPVLLLTTTGRKTKKKRTVPIVYMEDGENYVVAASFAGNEKHPAWWLNLMAHPQSTIQIKGDKRHVVGQQASPAERAELWSRWVARDPNFQQYQKRTTRQIPMGILRPVG